MKFLNKLAGLFKKRAILPYDGAGHGKRLVNWNPTGASVNSLIYNNADLLRRRSHDIVRKNPYAANSIDALVSNCIGTGIKPQSKASDAIFRQDIQELWLDWTDECDYNDVTDFYGLQAL